MVSPEARKFGYFRGGAPMISRAALQNYQEATHLLNQNYFGTSTYSECQCCQIQAATTKVAFWDSGVAARGPEYLRGWRGWRDVTQTAMMTCRAAGAEI